MKHALPYLIIVLLSTCLPATLRAGEADAAFAAYQAGDRAGAAARYGRLARQGDALAQFNYAMMLKRGEATGEAWLPWLEKSAKAGVMNAAYTLGIAYEHGDGVPRSQTDATRWFQLAAEKGHIDAQVSLATQYFLGRGAPHDETLAAHWYEKAAAAGDEAAQYLIASMYEHGYGVKVDKTKALDWYTAAARQGDRVAKEKAAELARAP